MNIQKISSYQTSFQKQKSEKKEQKHDLINKFQTGIKNSADMNDTVVVPRTIFKGYMAFTASTSLGALAAALKKFTKISTVLTTLSVISGLWGTYSFVRPYLVTDKISNN